MRDSDRANARRHFLHRWGVLLPVGLALPAWKGNAADAGPRELALTPACSNGEQPTPRQMEGPFFKPRSPQRTSFLEAGLRGTRMVVSGQVLSTSCKPVVGALLDFWQCDDAGEYDNTGYRLRGHQFSDSAGRYRLETIVPGVYPGRTRHIHIKAQAAGGPILTTQLYFPGEPENQRDFLFRQELLMVITRADGARAGHFDFVLKVAQSAVGGSHDG
jgi:protocatechuate 3,4-dioxygenase beta subunit